MADGAPRFTLLTETDARNLPHGSIVVLEPGGMITPLARDTLRAARVTVVYGQPNQLIEQLAPIADVRKVALGTDHTGLALRNAIRAWLRGRGIAVDDLGTDTEDPVDYPDIAARVSRQVVRAEADAGIVIDGSGLGSAIAANKIAGVRAAMCSDRTLARYAREHTGANVLTLGSRLLTPDDALGVVETWLATPMREPRYLQRLAKVAQLERER